MQPTIAVHRSINRVLVPHSITHRRSRKKCTVVNFRKPLAVAVTMPSAAVVIEVQAHVPLDTDFYGVQLLLRDRL